ncbi:MAG: hypothetical protein DHS20C17_27530 [Cyclobacteriaceae bacterium]|nr:MAG: hypothetical protein DHS20C17_27530 [Cyclobacteriaceae bacterium]
MNFKQEFIAAIESHWQLLIQWSPRLAIGVLILVVFLFFSIRIKRLVINRLKNTMNDPLLARFLSGLAKWVFIVIGVSLAMHTMGLGGIAGGLVAGAGVSAFIIGFAFKDIGENFLAGILMAFHRPFRVGDTIEIEDTIGNVVALDLRTTQVKTLDGKDVFIPNSLLIKNELINYTIDGFLRQDFTVSVDYQTDISVAISIILETLDEVSGILKEDKRPSVAVSRLDSSSIALQVFYWLDTFDKSVQGLKVKTEAIQRTLKALDQAKVYMPADIVEMKNYREDVFKTVGE